MIRFTRKNIQTNILVQLSSVLFASLALCAALITTPTYATETNPVDTASKTSRLDTDINAPAPSLSTPATVVPSATSVAPVHNNANAESSFVSNLGNRAKDFFSSMAHKTNELMMSAMDMIGVPYRWGGSNPKTGLDCSGFVRYVFENALGFMLPRRAEEMSRVGKKVVATQLKPGDLVFFNTMRRAFSHVGIYIGNNKFIHSPSTGGNVRIDDIRASYWARRYNGARRVEVLQERRPEVLQEAS